MLTRSSSVERIRGGFMSEGFPGQVSDSTFRSLFLLLI